MDIVRDEDDRDQVMFERATPFQIDMNFHYYGKPLHRLIEKLNDDYINRNTDDKLTCKWPTDYLEMTYIHHLQI